MTFELHKPIETQELLTGEEQQMLLRYGPTAHGLVIGELRPTTDKHYRFLAVATHKEPPLSRWEYLWLRYQESIRIDSLVEELRHEMAVLRSAAFQQVGKRKQAEAQAEERQKAIRVLSIKLHQYEIKLGIVEPDPPTPTDSYEINGGTCDTWREQP